jgi:hypothetical protein
VGGQVGVGELGQRHHHRAETDVRVAFHWLREALLKPLRPGARVIVFSSGAAVNPNGSDAATLALAYRLTGTGLQIFI